MRVIVSLLINEEIEPKETGVMKVFILAFLLLRYKNTNELIFKKTMFFFFFLLRNRKNFFRLTLST